jgi:alpha-D-xyloside xylohydrolase
VLPTAELYIRATEMAAFSPVMQWHSDLVNGQFNNLVPSAGGINDRSPWNMAQFCSDNNIIDVSLKYANMHMNLSPYLYQIAKECADQSKPMMRHLYYDYHDDKNVVNIEDEFMLGDLLVAPIMDEGKSKRSVYLPKGEWMNIFTGKEDVGESSIEVHAAIDEIPVFIKKGSAMALNLNNKFEFGGSVSNSIDEYVNLCIYVSGDIGEYVFKDNDVDIQLSLEDGRLDYKSNKEFYIISKYRLDNVTECDIIAFSNYNAYLYKIGK